MLDYYYGIIMIGLALFIFERAILACVFKHIAELKGYYGIKEWLLVFFSWNLWYFIYLDVTYKK